ncbi:MAG TPA: MFS transporter [Rhodospirillales bacterium]|jgi:MFS family permease|nr:MFS transporter [Rhodospirillales bacterium]
MAHSRETHAVVARRASVRNVILLGSGLALAMTGTALVMTVSALAGEMLATDKRLATLPLALQFAAMLVTAIPAALLMKRVGRRPGFVLGQVVGVVAAVVAALGIWMGSFVVFCVGSAMLGVHNAFWQYYRFAAAEVSAPEFRSRAISFVLAGGVVAAIAGPQLAILSRDWLAPVTFAGSYVVIAILCAAAIAILGFTTLPKPGKDESRRSGRPISVLIRQPALITAVLSAMVGFGVMSMVMTATPIAMVASGHEFADAAFVIQWHALGMYVPSFFTGALIARFGTLRVIGAGIVLNILCVAVNAAGIAIGNFWAGLVLLGVGWNFMFVGGTTLLTETYEPEERAKVQGFNDFMVWGMVTVLSLSSGALFHQFGWLVVNLGVIVPVLASLLAIAWLASLRRAAAAAAE